MELWPGPLPLSWETQGKWLPFAESLLSLGHAIAPLVGIGSSTALPETARLAVALNSETLTFLATPGCLHLAVNSSSCGEGCAVDTSRLTLGL